MNSSRIVAAILLISSFALADGKAEEYYASVERHLRSLPSLEIGYRATGADFPEGGIEGRLAFQRPDGFYHDTPEWTHCENGADQWRFLKEQQTLILEDLEGRAEWSPEAVLLSLNRDLVPFDLYGVEGGDTVLVLDALSEQMSGQVRMQFESGRRAPTVIEFIDDAGSSQSRYEILMWHESVTFDSMLFQPPVVSDENRIDFRSR